MKRRTAQVIAIDPGLRAMGTAVLDQDGHLLAAAVWTTSPRAPRRAAERHLMARLNDLLLRHSPSLVVIEETFPTRSRALAPVHRIALLCKERARALGVHVAAVASGSVRRRMLGNGRAGKRDVARFCATLYPELRVYLNQRQRWQERHFGNLFDAVLLAADALSNRAQVDARYRTPHHRFRWFSLRLGFGAGRLRRRDPEVRRRA